MAKKKKKKAGSIAIPYLITIFLGILIIGGGSFILLKHLGVLGRSNELKEPTPRQVEITSYADNHTILMVLDEPDMRCTSTFMLVRSIPKDKKIVFMGIPTNTITVVNEKQQDIKTAYETGGATSAVKFVEAAFDINVDRYMILNSKTLIKICDIFGGVNYPVSSDVAGFNGDGTEQYLNAEQIEKLLTYALYADGEVERAYVASSVTTSMLNQTDNLRISENLDSIFNTVVNMIDTDITSVDYKQYKACIKNMLERGSNIASFVILEGDSAYEEYIPKDSFVKSFKAKYYSFNENKDGADEGK